MKLEARGLCKSFDQVTVLDELTFSLEGANSVAVIGPSGSGKSTLLRVLAGLERPDRGEIRVNEHTLSFTDAGLHAYRRQIAVVFQAFNLFPHLTALRNITLPLQLTRGWTQLEASAKAEELLRRFQLLDHGHKMPVQLSGGQQQRVAIARALALQPEILLLDEPTSSLDPEFTAEVLDMIGELREQGQQLLLVTHEMGFARQACDVTLFLAAGRVLEHGPSARVFTAPATPELRAFLHRVLEWR